MLSKRVGYILVVLLMVMLSVLVASFVRSAADDGLRESLDGVVFVLLLLFFLGTFIMWVRMSVDCVTKLLTKGWEWRLIFWLAIMFVVWAASFYYYFVEFRRSRMEQDHQRRSHERPNDRNGATRPRRKQLPVVVRAIALAVAGVVALALLMLCNPMLLMFLSSFEIINESGADIWVTPVGRWEGSGHYGPLPRYWNGTPPAIPSWRRHEVPIKIGDRLEIVYDCDDINFRHLLVRTDSGEVYITDTDKKGTIHYTYPPQQSSYRIPPLSEMQLAPDELLPCTQGESVRYSAAVDYPEPADPLPRASGSRGDSTP